MRIEMRVNNGSTTLLLVDDAGVVRNEWPVDFKAMQDFINGGDPADWAVSYNDHAPADSYGDLIAIRTVDGVYAERFDAYIYRLRSFGLTAQLLGEIGVNPDTFIGYLYDVSFEVGGRSGWVTRGDYLGWEEARRGLINDLPDSQEELRNVRNCFVCMTRWENGHGVGMESRPVDPITGDWA